MKFNIKTTIVTAAVLGLTTVGFAADTWTLTGKIIDSQSNLPVSGAAVSFVYNEGGQIDTKTDLKGDYTLQPEINKEGHLIIKGDRYNELKDHYGARGNIRDYVRNDYRLYHDYFTINGKIVDNVTGNPIKGASVKFVYDDGKDEKDNIIKRGETKAVLTDDNGKYFLQPQIGLSGKIVISNEGYITREDHAYAKSSNEVVTWNYEIRKTDEAWTIKGKVYDNKTWLPVPDASVSFVYEEGSQVATITTDANGMYKVNPLIGKNGSLIIKKDKYVDIVERQYSRSKGDEILHRDYAFKHDYWILQGTVVDYKTNEPVKDIKVAFENASYTFDCKTNEKGFYQMQIKIGDGGKLSLSGNNWITKEEDMRAGSSDELVNKNYSIHRANEVYKLSGLVKENYTWDGIAGALVTYTYEDGKTATATTDALGHYTIYPEVGKAGELSISKESFRTYKDKLYSVNDSRTCNTRNCSLYHDYWNLSGTVTDYKTGNGVAGVKVAFVYEDGSETSTLTNADGTYSMKPKSGIKGDIRVSCDSWKTIFEEKYSFDSDRNEVWNYKIHKIKETYTLTGKIVSNEEKSPAISGANVEYTDEEGGRITVKTDADGNYTLYPELGKKGFLRITANDFTPRRTEIGTVSDSRYRTDSIFVLEKKKEEK